MQFNFDDTFNSLHRSITPLVSQIRPHIGYLISWNEILDKSNSSLDFPDQAQLRAASFAIRTLDSIKAALKLAQCNFSFSSPAYPNYVHLMSLKAQKKMTEVYNACPDQWRPNQLLRRPREIGGIFFIDKTDCDRVQFQVNDTLFDMAVPGVLMYELCHTDLTLELKECMWSTFEDLVLLHDTLNLYFNDDYKRCGNEFPSEKTIQAIQNVQLVVVGHSKNPVSGHKTLIDFLAISYPCWHELTKDLSSKSIGYLHFQQSDEEPHLVDLVQEESEARSITVSSVSDDEVCDLDKTNNQSRPSQIEVNPINCTFLEDLSVDSSLYKALLPLNWEVRTKKIKKKAASKHLNVSLALKKRRK
jgi:hypothetical protein